MKKLLKMPDLVQDLAGNFSVHLIARYAFDVADTFHKFYENVRVVSEDKKLSEARLQLIVATRIVLSNTLKLMGISAPERM
jgi:arginyl-tRNA synthetase